MMRNKAASVDVVSIAGTCVVNLEGPTAMSANIDKSRLKSKRLEGAWQAYATMARAQIADPSLRQNPIWQELKAEAYEHFSGKMS